MEMENGRDAMAGVDIRVLAVDEDPVYLQTLSEMLRRCGYQGMRTIPSTLLVFMASCSILRTETGGCVGACSDGHGVASGSAEGGDEEPGGSRRRLDRLRHPWDRIRRVRPP